MAACDWGRWWWVVALALLPSPQPAECRNITHEDIRDAMLSLVHMFRTSEDKLERHEYREKALGEQLKKILAGLEKKHRALEPLKGMISRLDERLSNVETVLFQKENRENATQRETKDALDGIRQSLLDLTASLPGLKPDAPAVPEDNLTTDDDALSRRLDLTDAKLDAVRQEIASLKSSLSKEALRSMCLEVGSTGNPLEKHISAADQLLTKYELKLSELGNASKVPTDFVPLSEVSLADEAWHSKMSEVMERQEGEIKKIQQLLSDAESMWKGLPRLTDLHQAANETLAALAATKDAVTSAHEESVNKLTAKLRELSDRLVATNADIQNSLTQGNAMSERAYSDISRSYDKLTKEVSTLSKNDHIMVVTADNVIATKQRIEYGMQQILTEVSDQMRAQSNHLNDTITQRFNAIEATIVFNQVSALSNLSSKIESEMSQVWRQIGTMYQQLTASKGSLDKLTAQTETYVNGSSIRLDSMNDKVGLITARMSEVDSNLNFLLGQLSLITHEFAQVKAGLSDALDKVNNNLHAVQDKIQDSGPGPHMITGSSATTGV